MSEQGHIPPCMHVGNEGKHHIHTCTMYIYECIYIASPVIVHVLTNLFSVRGRRKEVRQSKTVKGSAKRPWGGQQHS